MAMIEASEITKNLWQGSVPEPGTYVAEAGFDVLVLSAREHQRSSIYYPGVQVLHAPNDDNERYPFTREKLRIALHAARQSAEAIKEGKSVLVTCAAGLNRSGLISALTLHFLHGWSGAQCIKVVREKRGLWRDPQPLSNDEFVTVLNRLPEKLIPEEERVVPPELQK